MKLFKYLLLGSFLFNTSVWAACDFVWESTKDEDGEEVTNLVKAPAWFKKKMKEVEIEELVPQNVVSQAMGFAPVETKGMKDGTFELCKAPNHLFLKMSCKNELADGLWEHYDSETFQMTAKGYYKKGLRTGTWQMRNEEGDMTSIQFEDGLPADLKNNPLAQSFLESVIAQKLDASVNTAVRNSVKENGGNPNKVAKTKKTGKSLSAWAQENKAQIKKETGADVDALQEGYQKTMDEMDRIMKELQNLKYEN